jgi:outer membrane protein assembly factor BamB
MSRSFSTETMSVRWWPAAAILTLASLVMLFIWGFLEAPRQEKNIISAFVFIASTALLLIWWCFLSRIRMRLRLGAVVSLVAVLGLATQIFEIVGVSGDLVPIIRLKSEKVQEMPSDSTPVPASIPSTGTVEEVQSSFPQFLGPDRNAILTGIALSSEQIRTAPQELWRQAVGQGWSGFVVEGSFAYTQEQEGEKEAVTCYQLASGTLIWKFTYSAEYASVIAGNGPRSTPTIAGNYLVTLGSTGVLTCLERFSGKLIWSHDVVQENGAGIPEWGVSASPLVAGKEVTVPVGDKGKNGLQVFNLETGSLIRSYPSISSSYSSPILARWDDHTQMLYMHHRGVAGFAVDRDEKLWDMAWGNHYPDVALPLVLPGMKVFISSGYGVGCSLLQLKVNHDELWSVETIWKHRSMKAKFTNLVTRDGYVYGLDDGMMACISLEDGTRQWKEGRYGHGQMFLLDNVMMVLSEKGDIIWMEINPREAKVISQWHALDGKTWNPPCLAWPYLLLRNDQEAVCYQFSTSE